MKKCRVFTTRVFRLMIAPILLALLVGCGDPITKLLNERFPPISADEQRKKAIETTALALHSVYSANVAVSVLFSDIEKVMFSEELKKMGVNKLNLSGDEQLIKVEFEFKRVFGRADSPDDAKLADLLDKLKPAIEGVIDFYFGVSGGVAGDDANGQPTLKLQLLPALSRVQISKLKLADSVDATQAAEWLAQLITKYRDNASGELSRHPLATVSIPVAGPQPIDVSQAIHIESPGTKFQAAVTASPSVTPVKFVGIAWLIDDDRLTSVVQFAPLDWLPQKTDPKVEESFLAIKGQINGIVRDVFGATENKHSWVGVRKDLIAYSLNSVVKQASACILASGRTRQRQESKIPMPGSEAVNCDTGQCSSGRQCSFDANHDTRDCQTCLLSRPVLCAPKVCAFGSCVGGGCTGGGCIQRGNDPLCEGAKAAQNVIYVADANKRKFECDAAREAEILACQVKNGATKLLCEAGKETLKALKRTGNFANIDMEADIKANDVKVCLKDFALSPGLDSVTLNLGVKGNAKVAVDLKFTPLDIVGHLACQWPWSDKKEFDASIPQQDLNMTSTVTIQTAEEKPKLKFVVDKTDATGNVSPGPTEYLVTNVPLTLSCAGLNFIKPLVVVATPFLPQLRGEFKQEIAKQEVSVDLPVSSARIGDVEFLPHVETTPLALLLALRAK